MTTTIAENREASPRSLSALLEKLRDDVKSAPALTLDTLIEALHERGFGALLLIFSVPMALPLPVPPGINVILASPLLILTFQLMLGRHTIWMPRKLREKPMSQPQMIETLEGALPWVRRLETFIKPRLGWVTQDGPSRFFGFLGVLMALTVCIPVPLTNTVPSLGIALMAVGLLVRDGLAIISGAFVGMAWIMLLTTAVLLFGSEAFEIIKDFIKTWL